MFKIGWADQISREMDEAYERLREDRKQYDKETKGQLEEVKNSDWSSAKYLREILWELRYARRKADRP